MDRPILFDTSVLIDFRRGSVDASRFAAPLVARGLAAIHPVVIFELMVGITPQKEVETTLRLVSAFRRTPVRDSDFVAAQGFLEGLHRSHGVGWPDALIAATAIRLKIPVATLNDKHFRPFKALRVVRPY